jgi:hypothetical protein
LQEGLFFLVRLWLFPFLMHSRPRSFRLT